MANRLKGQGKWALIDQAISSGTNFGATVFVARLVGPAEFGSYAYAIVGWTLMVGMTRAFLTQPYIVRVSPLSRQEWREQTRAAAGSTCYLGVVSALVVGAVAFLAGPSQPTGRALLALAVFAPALLLQDFWRFAGFSSQRARSAATNDVVWAAAQGLGFLALLAWGNVTAASALTAWGLGSLAGAGWGLRQFRVSPDFGKRTWRWVRRTATLGGWFAASAIMFQIGNQGVVMMLGLFGGRASVGGFRAVVNLFGPIQIVFLAGLSVGLPRLSKEKLQSGLSKVKQLTLRLTLALGIAGVCYALPVVLLGQTALGLLFGPSFERFAPLVLPVALAFAIPWSYATQTALRAIEAGRTLTIVTAVTATIRLALVAAAMPFFGLVGAAWALVLGSVVRSIVTALALRSYTLADVPDRVVSSLPTEGNPSG